MAIAKKWTYLHDYNIYNRYPREKISHSPITGDREKDEIIESVSDDIQRCNGELWYKIKGKWYSDSMLIVEATRKKYTLEGKFVCGTKCKR